MEIEHYFADIDVLVKLRSESGLICTLTDAEANAIMQVVYLALNCFSFTKLLYLAERSQANELEG